VAREISRRRRTVSFIDGDEQSSRTRRDAGKARYWARHARLVRHIKQSGRPTGAEVSVGKGKGHGCALYALAKKTGFAKSLSPYDS